MRNYFHATDACVSMDINAEIACINAGLVCVCVCVCVWVIRRPFKSILDQYSTWCERATALARRSAAVSGSRTLKPTPIIYPTAALRSIDDRKPDCAVRTRGRSLNFYRIYGKFNNDGDAPTFTFTTEPPNHKQ